MEEFESKYTGEQVEERLDRIDELTDDIENIENSLSATNLPVSVPLIDVVWTAYDQKGRQIDSVPDEDGSLSNPVVEVGYKMTYSAKYKWSSVSGYQNPESVDVDNSNWDAALPLSGQWSRVISIENPTIISSTALTITLQAKEVGYKANASGFLFPATGYVKSSASVGVTFKKRLFHGKSSSATIDDVTIKNLSTKKLVSSHSVEVDNMSTSNGEYYFYAFPTRLSKITADGGTVWDKSIQDSQGGDKQAFIEREVSITNAAGLEQTYYAYRTSQSGSLSNTTLRFS